MCDLNKWFFVKKSGDLSRTNFHIFQLILWCKASYIAKVIELWLIVAYLLFAQQEYNWRYQNCGSHVVYVTEQTDQFQKFGKYLAWKYECKNNKKSDLNQKADLNQKNLIFFI